MRITASMVGAVVVCPRQAWFMSRAFSPEKENYFIAIGKLVHEESYMEMKLKEISLNGAKIDFVTTKNGETIIAEVKKSSAVVESGKVQLLYYMKLLKDAGVNAHGELRIPKEKKVLKVELTEETEELLNGYVEKLKEVISLEKPPKILNSKNCPKCGYYHMCFS